MSEAIKNEESAPVQEGLIESVPSKTQKEINDEENQRKQYIKHMRKQNEVLEEDVRFMRLTLERFTLNQRIADINKKLDESKEDTPPGAPLIEIVKNAKTS